MLAFNPVGTLEENENMQEALSHVKTGQITYAVRDTEIDGVAIQKMISCVLQMGKLYLQMLKSRSEAITRSAY